MAPIQISLSKKDLSDIKALTKKGLVDVRVVKRALILKYRHLELGTKEITELLDVDPSLIPCLLYTSPSPRDLSTSRMPSSA